MCIYIYIYICIGGWGCELFVRKTPEPGNRFRLRLRCVRACVRAKLCGCETIRLWLGAARFHYPGVRPSGPLCVASQNHSLVRIAANRCEIAANRF